MRRGIWLIWLCIALLPLRGMAHGLMLGAGATHGAAAMQAEATVEAPCPMHAAADAASVGDGAATPGASSMNGCCHLCGVCHGAMLPTVAAEPLQAEAPRSTPRAHAGVGAGRDAPDSLFRPPR